MKKFAAGALAACALCLALVPGAAWAAVDPEAVLQKVDGSDDVAVSLKLPEGARDNVRTLRLTLTVKGADLDGVEAGFAFDGSLDGVAVKEARYRHEGSEGILSLYLAGDANLFANDTLALGSVRLAGEEGATVEIGVGSLSVVNAAHDASDPAVYSQGSCRWNSGPKARPRTRPSLLRAKARATSPAPATTRVPVKAPEREAETGARAPATVRPTRAPARPPARTSRS
ncbi:MAG: hypothetical protein V8S24_11760 [Gordonibacter pamelaeae]